MYARRINSARLSKMVWVKNPFLRLVSIKIADKHSKGRSVKMESEDHME